MTASSVAHPLLSQDTFSRFFENDDDYFGPQRARRSELPDPESLLMNLTHCVIEVLAGARDLEQLARWVSDDVYRGLSKRVVLAARARRVKGQAPQRPAFSLGRVRMCEPADGVVEAVVPVHQRARSRAVAIRLEGFDQRGESNRDLRALAEFLRHWLADLGKIFGHLEKNGSHTSDIC